MANQLKRARIQATLGLLERGWSCRRIIPELGVQREIVARYDRLKRRAMLRTSIVTLDSAPPPPGQVSRCVPSKGIIFQKLGAALSAQRIWQDLVPEHGFERSCSSVNPYVGHLGASTPLPFRRMECASGQEVQVDFGTGAWVIGQDGKRRRPHLFRIVLSHSRHAHSEVVWCQDTESFLRWLENAFRAFGGMPRTDILDNFNAAVITPDWYDVDLNPRSDKGHGGSQDTPVTGSSTSPTLAIPPLLPSPEETHGTRPSMLKLATLLQETRLLLAIRAGGRDHVLVVNQDNAGAQGNGHGANDRAGVHTKFLEGHRPDPAQYA